MAKSCFTRQKNAAMATSAVFVKPGIALTQALDASLGGMKNDEMSEYD